MDRRGFCISGETPSRAPPAWDAGHRETVRSMQMARPERRCTPEDRRILSWAAQAAALPRPRMESGKENAPAR